METIQTKLESRRNDILYFLNKTIDKIKLLQLENIRNKEVYLFANSAISDLNITKQLIETSNLKLAIEIVSKVNELYKSDPTLSDVLLHFKNSKRNHNVYPAHIIFTV